ncbi:3-hydroxyacyl-CoA dehydrogenase family protein [Sporomusa termitida]|nr:3-hydroxyacyl-CoA dehydrogenase family protein [Sporomusa termitida]
MGDVETVTVKKIGVIGAGMMGAEIALCFAKCGYSVIMSDAKQEFADKGKARQAGILDKNISKGKLAAEQKDAILHRVATTETLADMADCDIVIEAVLEVFDVKTQIFKELDKICKASCIIASNTSSISITKLASTVSKERAARFIGTHFNSPASVMKLVEVIPGYLTEETVVAAVVELLLAIEKEPVRVKDVTGFALNRLFHVFTAEACRLVEEGVCSVEDVDKVCLYGLGHPMGIFKLLDLTGHDLNMQVDQILFDAYGDRFRPSAYMQRLVHAGLLGKKTGEGFYKYDK